MGKMEVEVEEEAWKGRRRGGGVEENTAGGKKMGKQTLRIYALYLR